MLPIRLRIYENTEAPPFRRMLRGRELSLPLFSGYFPNETPQNLGQMRDEAESPCPFGLEMS
jgi:hypothetical protein